MISPTGFIEYRGPRDEPWRIEDGEGLLATFCIQGSDASKMAALLLWHTCLCEAGKAWTMICRLYAINPMVGVEDMDELSPWPKEKVAEHLEMPVGAIDGLLADAVDLWKRWEAANQTGEVESENVQDVLDEVKIEKLLLENGFSEVEDKAERKFIAERLGDLEECLDGQRAMVRSLISQEVILFFVLDKQLAKLRKKLVVNTESTSTEDDRLSKMMKARSDAQEQIERTMKALGLSEAQTGAGKGKADFHRTISGVLDGIHAYESRGDRKILDGMFAADEIQILTKPFTLRASQYRPDFILAVPAVVDGLMDENFEMPDMPRSLRRRLMKGFGMGLQQARADEGESIEELDAESRESASDAALEDADTNGDTALLGGAAMTSTPAVAVAPPPPPREKEDRLTDF